MLQSHIKTLLGGISFHVHITTVFYSVPINFFSIFCYSASLSLSPPQNKTLAFRRPPRSLSLNAKFQNRPTMSTAEQGGATANATTSSYGGGGAGGKLRKKPLRRQTTPYDRPPTPLPVNNTNTDSYSSRLTKMVVDSASKLISYGAGRFIPSVFRRSLPPPPPPQPRQPPGFVLFLYS